MAERLTDRSALEAAPDSDDLVHIVDVSDTTDDASGTSKKITIENLLASAGGTSQTIMAKHLIQEIENVSAGEFDFTVPSGYDRLIIEGSFYSTQATPSYDDGRMYFNDDTTDANYLSQSNAGTNNTSVTLEDSSPRFYYVPATGRPAGRVARFRMVVENPDDASDAKMARIEVDGDYATDQSITSDFVIQSSVTDAITRIRLRTDNHPTDGFIGKLSLSGERESQIGGVSYPGNAGTLVTVREPIETIDLASAGSFEFNDILQVYDDLIIEGVVQYSNASAETGTVDIIINALTTASAYYFQILAANTDAFDDRGTDNKLCYAASGKTNSEAHSYLKAILPQYKNTAVRKNLNANWGCPANPGSVYFYTGQTTLDIPTSDAITDIEIKASDDPTNGLIGTLTLCGVRQIVMSPGKHEIETIENLTAGKFDFDSIPSGFKRLIIAGYIRCDASATEQELVAVFNEETTASDYHTQRSAISDNGTAGGQEYSDNRVARVVADNSPANSYTDFELIIENYTGSNLKIARSQYTSYRASDHIEAGSYSMVSGLTAAITRIRLQTDDDPTSELLGKLTLYGEM